MINPIDAEVLAKSILGNEDGFEEYPLSDIFAVLEVADDQYYNDDESFLPDSEYDVLYQYAKLSDPTNEYFLGVGSTTRGGKVDLPFQMGSLDQVYIGEMDAFITKHQLHQESGVISDKLDGASAMAVYAANGDFQIGYSRGDGVQGADISRHLRLIPSVPKNIVGLHEPITVRGENIISKANFPKAQIAKTRSGKNYKNPRNMVSGLMNASVNPSAVYECIEFIAYEIVGSELSKVDQFNLLLKMGFKVPHFTNVPFSVMSDAFLTDILNTRRENNLYEIDGLVIEVNSAQKRAEMNPTRSTLNPAYAIKYKVADASNIAFPKVVDVDINISKHGYLKPRVQIEPTELMGVTVTWATGFNMSFILENRIGPGARIQITRSGDVIPFIMSVVSPCPHAEYTTWFQQRVEDEGECHWTDSGIDLVLNDPDNHPTVRYQQLVDFFDTLKVAHLGGGNLQKIFDMGFETPESVIELTVEDLSALIGSRTNATKIHKGLREKLIDIPPYLLMGAHPAFGRGVGVRKMKKLYDAFKGDMTKCSSLSWITSVEGFEEKTARKIQAGYEPFLRFLGNINTFVQLKQYEAPKEGNLTGKIVVFTGFRDASLEKLVEAAGGKMGSSVSSKTTYVVTPTPDASTGKLEAARAKGIKVIGIEELKGMV